MLILTLALALAGAAQVQPGATLIDRNRIDRAPSPAIAAPPAPPRTPMTRVDAQAAATPIAGIRFLGAKAPAPVATAAQAFLGRMATRQTLSELAAALSTAYGDSGVALYTVAIPAQDFAGGIVAVSLTEGRIARAQIKTDQPDQHPLLRARMARLTAETPLSRGTFERQVTLIRAIPGMTVATAFEDPTHDGALVMTATPKQRRTRVTAGFSNRGVSGLGDGQIDVRGELYGAAVDGDQLSLSASAAIDLERYRYVAGGYAVPLTPDGLTASLGAAYLETQPRRLPIRGTAKQVNAALSYPLIRRFDRSADISLGVDGLDSENAAFGTLIADERTRAARLAVSYASTKPRRSITLAASLSRGFDAFGARTDPAQSEVGFAKATAAAGIGQAIGQRVFARVSASGQYSRDRLPAAERFAIGGEAIGRAFDIALLSGDRGAGGLGELAVRPLRTGSFAASELYGFVDGGKVTILPRGAFAGATYSLASAGVGLRARYREKAELGLEAARVIDDPYPGYAEDWRVSVAWRLNL